jgi:hypothetical protein
VATLSRSDYETIVKLCCPHCDAGGVAKLRASTNEWVHDSVPVRTAGRYAGGAMGGTFSHTICWASRFRNSAYAPRRDPEHPPPVAA